MPDEASISRVVAGGVRANAAGGTVAGVLWVVLGVVGPLALTAAILFVVFAAIRRGIDADASALGGVVLDSGITKMTTRFTGFRSEALVRGGMRRNHVRAVLTSSHLHLVERPQRYGIFERAELSRFTVGVAGDDLHLRSTDPPRAVGEVDYRIAVGDPERWVAALVAAGARRDP